MKAEKIIALLGFGNAKYMSAKTNNGDISKEIRQITASHGQHPYAVIVTCSDSRVIPEEIFMCGIGELFTIRVAGNVIGETQLGSIEYAAGHLDCNLVVVLGHTQCGAVGAAIEGPGSGFIKFLTDEIRDAIGEEKDDYRACCLNVTKGVRRIKEAFAGDERLKNLSVVGAVYDIKTGKVTWMEEVSQLLTT